MIVSYSPLILPPSPADDSNHAVFSVSSPLPYPYLPDGAPMKLFYIVDNHDNEFIGSIEECQCFIADQRPPVSHKLGGSIESDTSDKHKAVAGIRFCVEHPIVR